MCLAGRGPAPVQRRRPPRWPPPLESSSGSRGIVEISAEAEEEDPRSFLTASFRVAKEVGDEILVEKELCQDFVD